MSEYVNEHDPTACIDRAWKKASAAIYDLLTATLRDAEDTLRLEEFRSQGHQKEYLEASMGSFGAAAIDVKALASLLEKRTLSNTMHTERYKHTEEISRRLRSILANCNTAPPAYRIVTMETDSSEIIAQAEEHLNRAAETFAAVRIAKLEVKAAYQPEKSDSFFKQFNWRDLTPSELTMSPPFVVLVDTKHKLSQTIGKIFTLLESGLPVKIVTLRRPRKQDLQDSGHPAARPHSLSLEMIPVAFREVYFMQGYITDSDFNARFDAGIVSPRPGVLSVFWTDTPPDEADYRTRAERALGARAFPRLLYNPDLSAEFVSRFDLSGNPDLHSKWKRQEFSHRAEKDKTDSIARDFTFADFAAEENDFQDEFADLPGDIRPEQTVPLVEYLQLKMDKRAGRIPVIYAPDREQRLIRRVPSRALIALTEERLHLWQTLQEMAGIENPQIKSAEQKLKAALTTENEAALAAVKKEMEAETEQRAREAVNSAIRTLAARLIGIDPSEVGAATLPKPEALQEDPAIAAASIEQSDKAKSPSATARDAPDLPWLETAGCTTCDECTTINSRIFAYNEDKKAYIKDPYGGPYKDIVRAAEKCPAEIIHPGSPLDTDQKDIEKWIKRAEKYQ